MNYKQYKPIFYALLAAALYAVNSPLSKLLLNKIPPTFMASFLYLGAGIGMFFVFIIKNKNRSQDESKLTKQDLPFTVGMIILDIAAQILLMIGLTKTTSANASLLNNFEIVATSLIAFIIFKEAISRRVFLAISLITISSILISVEDLNSLSFTMGSIFVLLACICWGLENNCTRKLSVKDPLEIVIVKGLGSGTGCLLIALIIGEHVNNISYIIEALLLGFISYGLGILLYIYAQRYLGAAKTSAYYAISPFIGVLLSLIIFREFPSFVFIIALFIMIIGAYLASTDRKNQEQIDN